MRGEELFKVIDKRTGREAHPESIALDDEPFASNLVYCDMDGWYVNAYGELALLDECGSFDYPSDDRFELVWNKDALKKILAGEDI